MTTRRAIRWLFLGASLIVGCSGQPASVDIPDINPETAAAAAVGELDSDRDGQLSQDEATACPGIAGSIGRYDTDGDGYVSEEEIAARFRQWYGQGVGIFTVGCTVTLNNQPLAGAMVKLVPVSFLSNVIAPASGTTRESGRTMLTITSKDLPPELQGVRGVHAGLYRVEITHPSQNLPAKYNSQTILGCDVSLENQTQGLFFRLKTP